MKRTAYAGVFAFGIIGLLSDISAICAEKPATSERLQIPASINIERIRSLLQLTPEQSPYWLPVEATLREIARQQAGSKSEDYVRPLDRRTVLIVLDSAAVQRLAIAARPLLVTLGYAQKRTVSGLAQEMGLGPVLAALK